MAYKKFHQLAPEADHLIMAYKVRQYAGYHDNGEHSAAKRIKNIMDDMNIQNTVVVVARVYGGIPLGKMRFVNVDRAARDALSLLLN